MRLLSSLFAGAMLLAGSAMAQDVPVVGQPTDKALNFQPAATELARDLQGLDHMILIIITVITIFVTGLLIWVIIRYNSKTNPKPATFTHNSPLEVAWTIVPILVLVFIGAYSLPVLFKQQEIPTADITIKVTGNQWYWHYDYVDAGIGFDSYLVDGSYKIDDVAAGWGDDQEIGAPQVLDELAIKKLEYFGYAREQFLLATDTAIVVPVGKTVVMQVTAADVIHAWTIPAFGVKQDAVPGRLAHLWFKPEMEGTYFGQCSEICGLLHAYMPITVKVVSQDTYDKWLAANVATGAAPYVALNKMVVASNGLAAPVTVAAND